MQSSIKIKAVGYILKVSLLFTITSLILVIVSASLYWKGMLKRSIDEKLNLETQSLDLSLKEAEIEGLLLKLVQVTTLKEMGIYDKNCKLVGATSLNFTKDLCDSKGVFSSSEIEFLGNKYLVLYKLEFSFMREFLNYLGLLITFFMGFNILFFTGIYLVFNFSILKPIDKIKANLNSANWAVPKELNFIESKMHELQHEIEKSEQERLYFGLARTIVHDIRNPLQVISSSLSGDLSRDFIQERVKEIEFQIDSLLKKKSTGAEFYFYNPTYVIKELASELASIYPLDYKIEGLEHDLLIPLHVNNVKNIVGNLIRNSFEAESKNIHISIRSNSSSLEIVLSDDGIGIPDDIRKGLFIIDKTSKKDGNGIGLRSIKSTLQAFKGSISLVETQKGSAFKILIPCDTFKKAIHIEDDKYIRLDWAKKAKDRNIELLSIQTINDFVESDAGDKTTPFFIDSDLGNGMRGEELAKVLFDKGFINLFLASNKIEFESTKYPWIKGTVSKVNFF